MSESKKMSSPYAVLGDRPIDQWKVTELKEELKRRKLMTKGLKEDLVKRLDEAVRNENEEAQMNDIDSSQSVPQPEVQAENEVVFSSVADTTGDIINNGDNITDSLNINYEMVDRENNDNVSQKAVTDMSQTTEVDVSLVSKAIEESVGGSNVAGEECLGVVEKISVETTVMVSESITSEIAFSGQDLQNSESKIKCEVSNLVQDTLDSKPPHEERKLNSSDVNIQVADVSQVISDSISIDTVSITDKNELKDSLVVDDVKLAVDVKPEQSSNAVLDGGSSQSIDIDEPRADGIIVGEKDVIDDENADTPKKNGCEDVGSPEKLDLDRSSGDDSMEEDLLESKQVDSKLGSDHIIDKGAIVEVSDVKEATVLDAMVEDTPADTKIDSEKVEVTVVNEDINVDAVVGDIAVDALTVNVKNENGLAAASVKRKLHEQEATGSTDVEKRQRRWNSESLKVSEPLGGNSSASNTPKDSVQPTFKNKFSRSNSAVNDEVPKERVVPPSLQTPTNSLRIDRFLRPFTLKAVQELLGKTGSIASFWMDHIKTHCYVTYSSVEEAIETRNAVYNLQWPTNGGRLLVAEFVDPQEVKNRVETPPPTPVTPVSTVPTLPPPQPSQPSPRLQVQRQQLPPPPPLPLPPPPPLMNVTNPPPVRERLLPPPPPLPEKVDPPIVTLDDLFRKTRATPRIYYLPLSEEQVAAKLKAHGKSIKQ